MRLIMIGFSVLLLACQAENSNDTGFDPEFAKELGADEYGMKQYVFAFLRTGKGDTIPKAERDKLIRGHLDNGGRLATSGKMVLAGPFLQKGDLRGIFIYNVASVDSAKKLIATDPAIQAGIFEVELIPWYGTSVLQKLSEWHPRAAKKGI